MLNLGPHESLEVRREDPEELEVEVRYEPGGKPPPKHFHPHQDEHFEVLTGTLSFRVDGDERTLAAGETIDIPRGKVHQVWNAGGEPASATWITRPALRTRQWFEAIDGLHREGRAGPATFAPLLAEYDDVFQLAVAPRPLTRAAVRAIGAIAGWR